MARLYPLFSGSSGNSYYIGSAEAGILIDAGRSAKQITERLVEVFVYLSKGFDEGDLHLLVYLRDYIFELRL